MQREELHATNFWYVNVASSVFSVICPVYFLYSKISQIGLLKMTLYENAGRLRCSDLQELSALLLIAIK